MTKLTKTRLELLKMYREETEQARVDEYNASVARLKRAREAYVKIATPKLKELEPVFFACEEKEIYVHPMYSYFSHVYYATRRTGELVIRDSEEDARSDSWGEFIRETMCYKGNVIVNGKLYRINDRGVTAWGKPDWIAPFDNDPNSHKGANDNDWTASAIEDAAVTLSGDLNVWYHQFDLAIRVGMKGETK